MAIYAVLLRFFCRDLRTFVWRKIQPKIVSVEKKGQISCMSWPFPNILNPSTWAAVESAQDIVKSVTGSPWPVRQQWLSWSNHVLKISSLRMFKHLKVGSVLAGWQNKKEYLKILKNWTAGFNVQKYTTYGKRRKWFLLLCKTSVKTFVWNICETLKLCQMHLLHCSALVVSPFLLTNLHIIHPPHLPVYLLISNLTFVYMSISKFYIFKFIFIISYLYFAHLHICWLAILYLQCARGHVVCSDCRPNVSTCPQVSASPLLKRYLQSLLYFIFPLKVFSNLYLQQTQTVSA